MKLTRRKLFVAQIILFTLITIGIGTLVFYFPNLPPILRSRIKKGSVDLNSEKSHRIDDRFLDWFNRDPERDIPTEPNVIVSPADGFITAIQPINEAVHIVIEMRYTDVHVQRVPIDGKIVTIEGGGKQLPADHSVGDYTLEKLMPYQKVTVFDTEIGYVVVRQITSYFARRISVFIGCEGWRDNHCQIQIITVTMWRTDSVYRVEI
jgi:hypothetical protein